MTLTNDACNPVAIACLPRHMCETAHVQMEACCAVASGRGRQVRAPQLRQIPMRAQVADLKAMCKERGISGYSKHRKSQLVRVLKEAMLVESE